MNKQGNSYTIIYIVVLVLLVGVALSSVSMALKQQQQANADNDKRRQILASVLVAPSPENLQSEFEKYIVGELVVNSAGDSIGNDAFTVDVAAQSKLPEAERQLPVFICRVNDSTKYIIPLYGAGLWGPIWGYISLDDNFSTVYGAYFDHQGETPGLGAEIAKPEFSSRFENKNIFINNVLRPIAVVKKGMKPVGDEDYVDGISGGTITSKGVGSMLANCLAPYNTFFMKRRLLK